MDSYKIGEVASIFGLSNDTIRYYESRGIVTPSRNEESGYRYYDSWDINFLLDCLRFRSYDFPISDIEQMLKSDDVEDVMKKLFERERDLIAKIEEQKNILKQVSKMKKDLYEIRQRLGVFNMEKSPEMIWQAQRERIRSEEGRLPQGTAALNVREWAKHMLYLNHTFVMPPIKDRQSFDEYSWGFSLSPSKFTELGLEMNEATVYIPGNDSIHTVFAAGEKDTFLPCIHEQVIDPIKEKGYRISSLPYGNLLVRVHENGEMKRYMEVWVPVET